MPDALAALKSALPDVVIQENELLGPFTALHIGGAARYFLRARSTEALKTAVLTAQALKFPLFLLGGGCNVLVSDAGFPGLVVKNEDRHWQADGELVRCGAGVPLLFLVREAAKLGNTGFEFAAAIPGTVGGVVRMNVGIGEKTVSDNVVRVQILEGKDTRWLDKAECAFRKSASVFLDHPDWVILEVEFFLEFGLKEYAEAKISEILQEKAIRQPLGIPGVLAFRDEKRDGTWVSAGEFIKEVGLDGYAIAGASVLKHDPNYIVNTGGATAAQVVELMSLVKTRVRDELGIELHDAIDLVGF